MMKWWWLVGAMGAVAVAVRAEEQPKTVSQIAEAAKPAVVVVRQIGRDGKEFGVGSGFIVDAAGLIATNMHVIGEARRIVVKLHDGSTHEATAVHAWDRKLDLAVVRIDAKGLTALPLGDSTALPQGERVVAMGNPLGLEHSVVEGVVSARREMDEINMIQLAIPIEAGNSGGPLLNMQGQAMGLLTMKSLVTENLGFAVPVEALKPLLEKPNPIPMTRWLTIGAIDGQRWTSLFGARWRQRAGRIIVEGEGDGFGGRALLLSTTQPPQESYEATVTVRLDDESGAAGLAFGSDGGDKHWGFYPSGGQLRLTRFNGPSVFTWQVLHDTASEHYRPGDWNTLKVRVEKDRLRCFVNGRAVIEQPVNGPITGRAGLCKFRETHATFRQFRIAAELADETIDAAEAAKLSERIGDVPAAGELPRDLIESLRPDADAALSLLRDRASRLEQQADQLRRLAEAVHHRRVIAELTAALEGEEPAIDLFHAALLVAKLDNEEVDIEAYRAEVDRMGREVRQSLADFDQADASAKLAALDRYLFIDNGYHGSRTDYYNRSNSYLNEVLDDREGLPITLSVLYMEVGRRIGLNIAGVPLPGHFVVRFEPDGEGASPQLIDVFDGGKRMTRQEAEQRVMATIGRPLEPGDLAPATKRQIIIRMIRNVMNIAYQDNPEGGAMRYLDALVALDPADAQARWVRMIMQGRIGAYAGALEDADWLLEHGGEGIDPHRVEQFRRALMQRRGP